MKEIIYRIKFILLANKMRKKYKLTDQGTRLYKYIKDKLAGDNSYSIGKFDDMFTNLAENNNLSVEEVMRMLQVCIEITGGAE